MPGVARRKGRAAPKQKCPWISKGISLKPGAEERNRTPDLLITNELLYRLSYFGNTTG